MRFAWKFARNRNRWQKDAPTSAAAKAVSRYVGFFVSVVVGSIGCAETPDYSDELPRITPTPPVAAISTLDVAEGFEMELIAAEPLVTSPVAMEWDASGALFVCEMRGYSEDRQQGMSRIARLRDRDGDGVYDERTTYADGLFWPTAIFPYDGGLFVGDAPDLFYFKDTDGDGVSDRKQRVLTGFGTSNVQGLLNSFRWGLDNRIHIACSSVGGSIRHPHAAGDDGGQNIRGRDLAFDPKTYQFQATSGAAQHGMCFDDWGHKFASSNSDHIQQVMYRDADIAANPFYSPPPSRLSIAEDGPQAEVYRASPVEPWRKVRTRLRVSGRAKGPIEGGGRAAGYFTGATGVTIYRGDAWPAKWKGTAIVGDVGSNLIHRKRLQLSGLEFIARRIDDQDEFVTSTDIWFRPAQFANAPDGTLHVIDMYREVIEHPASLPPEIKKHLDLTSGRDRGRLYRIVPTGFQPRPIENLHAASTAQLCSLLAHPNAWHRETAARLLYQRQDQSAVPRLVSLIENSASPLGRMHALYALDGLGHLDAATLDLGLTDSNAHVRRHAVRLSRAFQDVPSVGERYEELAADESIEVRYELAFALTDAVPQRRVAALTKILRQDPSDRWIQMAVQTAIGSEAKALVEILRNDETLAAQVGEDFEHQLVAQVQTRARNPDAATLKMAASTPTAVPARSAEETAERAAVVTRYLGALDRDGNRDRGQEVFKKNCSQCHRVDGIGHELGPNLAAIATRGAATLITSVMDPNREVNPQYLNYIVLTDDARVVSGMIVDEGSTSVTLRQADNATETLLRVEIDEFHSSGKSFMPEGLESAIDEQAMADLVAYLIEPAH
ncbi:PVC-type heme-binding CxxCH protein [Allorhodopirellula solitaria]|uniref:Cytochrome c n=1 Tax=Allorhodopirellula solitaria TaxID=2527987 RepID=A0A5C5YJZ6_9BACT|nr:PVC-type heme-binding CxxCH protein [Allorhodopirellula solitaria]TWT75171.1 Cytochrome c [Allorhodopirellula solitaria]